LTQVIYKGTVTAVEVMKRSVNGLHEEMAESSTVVYIDWSLRVVLVTVAVFVLVKEFSIAKYHLIMTLTDSYN
jgi:hypothetical protein